ncbi:MAG: hypothetical protein LAP86_34040 [Acidobacteriia bacterium]|nr:hypothetical protein [Terriglobia bacterium]
MTRLVALSCLLSFCLVFRSGAQTSLSSDPLAISLAQQSVIVLTQNLPVSDVTLTANVLSTYGSDNETGTGTFKAKGFAESRVDLSLSGGTRSDVRTGTGSGTWKVNAATAKPYAGHNCQTDASWFFPALSSLSQTTNPSFIFKYIGKEQRGSANTQHIRVFQISATDPAGLVQRLSAEDFYLDLACIIR